MSHRRDAKTQWISNTSVTQRLLELSRGQFRENQTDIASDSAEFVIDAVESLADGMDAGIRTGHSKCLGLGVPRPGHYETDPCIRAVHLFERCSDHAGIVLGDPIAEEKVRNANRD